MKYMIGFVIIGLWLLMFVSGTGILIGSAPYKQADGATYLRCHYLTASSITKRDIPTKGRIGVACPNRM